MKFIVKLFPEITIKSKPVRKRYVQMLQTNISASLKKWINWYSVKTTWDHLEVIIDKKEDEEAAVAVLSKVPWIHSFIKVESYEFESMHDIYEKTMLFYSDKVLNKAFVVRAKRTWDHDFKSTDLERYIWGWILKNIEGTKVDLHKPEVTVRLEVKENEVHVIQDRFEWIWGYPVWVQDRVLSLISGWFDSPVASFLTMKRGAKVDYLFFNLWGKAHEIWVKQISHYLWHTFSPSIKSNFITVDFEEVVWELLKNVHHRYRWVILKRLMLKVADKIHDNFDYHGLVTWEALGQVSSQTLINLEVITKASASLILRPLLTADKEDIIATSRIIWTHDYSANMPEYCGIVSDKPATAAKMKDVLEEESKLAEWLIDRAYEARDVKSMQHLLSDVSEISKIEEVFEVKSWELVIDIREDLKRKRMPLEEADIQIPFYEINNRFKELDQAKTYLFYCDKGVISNLHALYLKDKWFTNIKVYRP